MHSVLHIIVDDLRPELGAYGCQPAHANLDRLADVGTVFDRGPSRSRPCAAELLPHGPPAGPQPVVGFNHFREDHPVWTTRPGLLLAAGGEALGAGKAFHPKLPPAYDGDRSWSAAALPYRNPCWNTADDPTASFQDGGLPCVPCAIDVEARLFHNGNVSIANEFCETDAFEDALTVDDALALLRGAHARGAHFYLAVGLHKPHMPWQASAADFALHPLESVDLPAHPLPPSDAPPLAYHFTDGHVRVVAAARCRRRRARRGARTARRRPGWIGRSVGLDELDALGIENSTAVVAHSTTAGNWESTTCGGR